jgi:hypothetical protein
MNLSASIDLPEQINIPNYWDDIVYAESDEVREDGDDGERDDDGEGSSSGSGESSSDPDDRA